MIPSEIYDEISRQLEIYASAFADVSNLSSEIAILDIERMSKSEEIEKRLSQQKAASDCINVLIADFDEEADKNEICTLVQEKIGSILVGGMIEE